MERNCGFELKLNTYKPDLHQALIDYKKGTIPFYLLETVFNEVGAWFLREKQDPRLMYRFIVEFSAVEDSTDLDVVKFFLHGFCGEYLEMTYNPERKRLIWEKRFEISSTRYRMVKHFLHLYQKPAVVDQRRVEPVRALEIV